MGLSRPVPGSLRGMQSPAWRRAKRGARWILTRATRPTYARSLSFVVGRDEFARVLNSRGLLGTGVEVGVNEGEFSEWILRDWKGRRLISVDPWDAGIDAHGLNQDPGQPTLDRIYERASARLARFGERSEIRRLTSVEAAAQVPEASLDFVYIDAMHDFESVRVDIDAWYGRVRPGGLLAGHDYWDGFRSGSMYGVASAVEQFCKGKGLIAAVTLRDMPEQSWFVEVP